MSNRHHYFRNTGKPFEKQIIDVADIYERNGVLALSKADPPTRIVPVNRIIYLANPYLDFVGCWQERGGRALFIEAKSTDKPELDLNSDGGLSETQVKNFRRWVGAGAAVGLLWEHKGQVVFVKWPTIEERLRAHKNKIHFHHGEAVKQGTGFVLYDFAVNLRNAYETTTAAAAA